MRPADLDQDLSSGALKPLYLFHGQDVLLRDRYLARMADAVSEGMRDFNLQTMLADETPPQQVIDAAKTMPFMVRPRVVILRGVDRYSADDLHPFLAYLADPNEDACLVLSADKIDMRLKFFKAVTQTGCDVAFEAPKGRGLSAWVKSAAAVRGKQMSDEAAQTLIAQVGDDLMELDVEIEKLGLYVWPQTRIGVDEVKAVARLGHKANVFKLGDAVGRQEPGAALAELSDLLLTEHHLPILAMLVRHFRLLFKARLALARRASQAEAAKALGVPPFVAGQYLDQARNLAGADIKKGLARLLEANLTLISSRAPARAVMERLVLDLSRLKRTGRPES